jgi:hypothetical protein
MSDEERRMAAESGSPPAADSEERSHKVPSWLAVFAAFLGAVVGVIVARLVLVGFAGMFDFAGKTVWDYRFAGKTVWNYLDVFLVPVAVAGATAWLTWKQNRRQRRDEAAQERHALAVENQQAQDEALRAYLDQIGQQLLDEKRPLLVSEQDESEKDAVVRTLARARTLTLLARIDGDRKSSVVQFLYESQLIVRHGKGLPYPGIVDLSGADLSKADLAWTKIGRIGRADLHLTNLKEAKLARAFLVGASLADADLSGATLEGAHLKGAKLLGAKLVGASLVEAILEATDLSEADLSEADLRGANLYYKRARDYGKDPRETTANLTKADLTGANLEGATVFEEQLSKVKSLKGATMPNGHKYEDWLQTREGQDWLRTYKKDLEKEKHKEGVYEAWRETTEGKMWLRAIGDDEEISGPS